MAQAIAEQQQGARPLGRDAALAQARRQRSLDRLFGGACLFFAVLVLVLLGGIIASLVQGSIPALLAFGPRFFATTIWNPNTEVFGALAPIYGTVVTSLIAMLIGVPVSFGIAIFLTELAPTWLRRPLGVAIELLAGIPSIIYGIWGLFVFAPLMSRFVQPFLIHALGPLPGIGFLFKGPPFGVGILTASVILAVMVLPFITSITRDVFETVPPMLKESAYGLGATTWEVITKVVIPYTRVGVIGGIMLGLGRALGETMAVTFVIGNANRIATSLLAPGTTISASIASQFNEAQAELHRSSLITLGLVLFVITFFVLAGAKLMLLRLQRKAGS